MKCWILLNKTIIDVMIKMSVEWLGGWNIICGGMLKEKECWITIEIKVDRLFVPIELEIKVRYSVVFLNTFYINLHNLMIDCLIHYEIIGCTRAVQYGKTEPYRTEPK